MKKDNKKLYLWQERLKSNQSAYQSETDQMDDREALYRGTNEVRAIVQGERKKKTPHVRNICAELVEAQTDSNIPKPKVTARRKEDEGKAKLIPAICPCSFDCRCNINNLASCLILPNFT